MHFINLLPSYNSTLRQTIMTTPPVMIYLGQEEREDSPDLDDIKQQEQEDSTQPYTIVPRTDLAKKADKRLIKVQHWLEMLMRPDTMMDKEYKTFMRYCTEFFIFNEQLWHKDTKGQHKMVIAQEQRLFLIASAHNNVGHHGFYTTNALITE